MRRVFTSLAVVAVLFAAPAFSSAQQIVLFDQAPELNPAGGAINVVTPAGDPQETFSTALVNDLTFDTAVEVQEVTAYFSNVNVAPWNDGGTFNAVLNIFDGDALTDADGAFDGGDFGSAVQVTALSPGASSGFAGVWSLTVSGLDIQLDAGDYFFGLTPEYAAADGQEFHVNAASLGDGAGGPTFFRNPANGIGLGAGWQDIANLGQPGFEASLTVRGEEIIPEPTSAGLLALGLVGLVSRRRR